MKRIKGFSLIELMVVIVILGILSLVFAPQGYAQECTSVVDVNISTNEITGDNYVAALWKDNFAVSTDTKKGRIYRITINVEDPAIPQKVKFYEFGSAGVSTASVRLIWQDTILSTGVTIPIQEIFHERYPLVFKRGLAIRKSNATTDVDVSIQYR